MRATFLLSDTDRHAHGLRDDINAFLHFHTRAGWRVREDDLTYWDEDEVERLIQVTVEFDHALDAADFGLWRELGRWLRWH